MSGMCPNRFPACSYDGYPGFDEHSASIDCGIQHNTNAGCLGTYPDCDGWNEYKVVVTDAIGTTCTSATIIMPIAYNNYGCTDPSGAPSNGYNFAYNMTAAGGTPGTPCS
jgi:hypothetical protein